MDLNDLVHAILAGNLLAARQWVADARRVQLRWESYERPLGLSEREMVLAAGLAELLAGRSGMRPPEWARGVGAFAEPIFLDPGIEKMPRTLAHSKLEAPEPLRKRNLFAMANFLDVR